MRIAVWHNLPSGGGKRALYYHVRGLVERGHYVESWCPPTADQRVLPLGALVKENIRPLTVAPKWRPGPFRHWMADHDHVVRRLSAIEDHCRRCATEINRGGFDVLFANSCTWFYNNPIGKYAEIPQLIYLQEPYRWLYEALPALPWAAYDAPKHLRWTLKHIKGRLKNSLTVHALRIQVREELNNARAFGRILVNSLYSRESVLRAYGIESEVCYLGVDTDLFSPAGLPKDDYVIGVGGIYIGKRIERAIAAVATIAARQRPTLVWVGNFADPDYLAGLNEQARRLEVRFVARVGVDDTELVRLLSSAAAMIYTPMLEPFGFAPLEANACGTPVVAIAEGGVRETVQDGESGFLLPGYDPEALGEALSRLLGDPRLALDMGERACRLARERWSLAAAIDRLESKLTAFAGDKRPQRPGAIG